MTAEPMKPAPPVTRKRAKPQPSNTNGDTISAKAGNFASLADRERPSLVAELQAKVEALKTFCNSTSEEHAHIGDDDRGTVRDAASKASEWLLESLEKQGSLEQCQDPVLLPSHIKDKLYDLDQATRPILTKPKPLPPKAAPPPPADAPPAEAKEEDGDAKMDDAAAAPEDAAAAAPEDAEMPDAPAAD